MRRLLPVVLQSCRGESASCSGNISFIKTFVASSVGRRNWNSSSTSRRLLNAPRFFGDAAASAAAPAAAAAPSSTSTATATLPKPPPPKLTPRKPKKKTSGNSRSSSSSAATRSSRSTSSTSSTGSPWRKSKLDPLVLGAIQDTQRNSVLRTQALLADPPAHIPLEHLTMAGNSLIAALGRCGRPHDALKALDRLAELGAPFNASTAAAAVSACSRAASMVGTLPRPWAERGRAIYMGYVEAAEAKAKAKAEEEEQTTRRKKEGPIRDRPLLRALLDCGARSMVRFLFWRAEERSEKSENGGKTLSFSLSLPLETLPEFSFFPKKKTQKTRKHDKQDPEAVWAALDEYDLAGIRPGPSELASLISSHARRRGVGEGGGGENGGASIGCGGEETDNVGGRGSASEARAAARKFLERYGDSWDPNVNCIRSMREEDDDDDESSSSSGELEEGDEEKRTERKRKKKASSSSSSPPSATISMMTPSVYNALLRAHARDGDLDGAYAVSFFTPFYFLFFSFEVGEKNSKRNARRRAKAFSSYYFAPSRFAAPVVSATFAPLSEEAA